jgi:SPOR domain
MGVPDVAKRLRDAIPGAARQLWNQMLRGQGMGRIVVRVYHPAGPASIALSPALDALTRQEWHWLYLQHLAESLGSLPEAEARRLLDAALALAEELVSAAYWTQVVGQRILAAPAGVVDLVPERLGGTALVIDVFRPLRARAHLTTSNLVLLTQVMRSAPHPLEQYELFGKIALFAEYCERLRRWHNRATLAAGSLYAVVHADLAGVRTLASRARATRRGVHEAAGLNRRSPAGGRPGWPPRPRPAIPVLTAALLWGALGLITLVIPHDGVGPPSARRPALPDAVSPGGLGQAERVPRNESPAGPVANSAPRVMRRSVPGAGGTGPAAFLTPTVRVVRAIPAVSGMPEPPHGSGGAGRGSRLFRPLSPAEAPDGGSPLPSEHRHESPGDARQDVGGGLSLRFRVVSNMLARDVAELQARALAERGIDSSVRTAGGNLARLQYGAYQSREIAEADARRIRAQGYSATVVGW